MTSTIPQPFRWASPSQSIRRRRLQRETYCLLPCPCESVPGLINTAQRGLISTVIFCCIGGIVLEANVGRNTRTQSLTANKPSQEILSYHALCYCLAFKRLLLAASFIETILSLCRKIVLGTYRVVPLPAKNRSLEWACTYATKLVPMV